VLDLSGSWLADAPLAGIRPQRILLAAAGRCLSLVVSPVILYWTGLLAGFHSLSIALALGGSASLGSRSSHVAGGDPTLTGALFQDPALPRIFAGILVLFGLMILIPLVQVRTHGG